MKNLIFTMLESALSGTEFQLRRSEDAFVRRFEQGRQAIGVPLWDYNPNFEFSLNICIRVRAVEDLFHRFSKSTKPSASFTTITRLAYFTGNGATYKVASAEDVANVGTKVFPVVHDRIIPFFHRHLTVAALDRAVNTEEPGLDVTQNPWAAMHAVILAHLAGNPRYHELVTKRRTLMQLSPEANHPFNQLVDYLATL